MSRLKTIAIIPARGGSKRIPGKNLLPVGGKPLLQHSIEQARQSSSVDRVIVSTDDNDITRVSKAAGAEVVLRPAELSNDKASSESALTHVLGYLNSKEQYVPDLVVFLQCTSPVRAPKDIDQAVEMLQKKGADSLFSACRNDKFIWRMIDGVPKALNYDPEHRPREQDFPEEYHENGSIFVFKPWVLEKFNNRLGGKMAVFEMSYWSSFQVDSPEDLALIEWIFMRKESRSSHQAAVIK